jgi:hypothetical protein
MHYTKIFIFFYELFVSVVNFTTVLCIDILVENKINTKTFATIWSPQFMIYFSELCSKWQQSNQLDQQIKQNGILSLEVPISNVYFTFL